MRLGSALSAKALDAEEHAARVRVRAKTLGFPFPDPFRTPNPYTLIISLHGKHLPDTCSPDGSSVVVLLGLSLLCGLVAQDACCTGLLHLQPVQHSFPKFPNFIDQPLLLVYRCEGLPVEPGVQELGRAAKEATAAKAVAEAEAARVRGLGTDIQRKACPLYALPHAAVTHPSRVGRARQPCACPCRSRLRAPRVGLVSGGMRVHQAVLYLPGVAWGLVGGCLPCWDKRASNDCRCEFSGVDRRRTSCEPPGGGGERVGGAHAARAGGARGARG